MPFQTIADFRMATRVVHGAGSVSRLPDLFSEGVKILVVSDKGLAEAGIVIGYSNVFWGGRSEIKPSEIAPGAYAEWCIDHGVDPDTMR